ncbi:MAG TPA: ATP-binding protein [Candidatus Eisenbacteria bacterium]|nr:ATP-binding protein [Candidatus Eisenbacteria bacterium]
MGSKRRTGGGRSEVDATADAVIIAEWKRFAARKLGSSDRVVEGGCFLDAPPCPFDGRSSFEERFATDCVRCVRLRRAAAQVETSPPEGAGAIPTLGLLLRLHEVSQGSGSGAGAPPPSSEDDGSRFGAASILLRALPMLHAASGLRRTARVLAASIAGAFSDVIDTVLFFDALGEANTLRLECAFRRADVGIPVGDRDGFLDVELLAAGGAFDGEVFDRLREMPIPLDQDRDLLSDAVFEGRTTVVAHPAREFRLPTLLVDHLPDAPAAIIPVFGRERVRGILVVSAAPGIGGFTSDQMELLMAAATQAGMALEGASLLDLARRRGGGLHAIYDLLASLLKHAGGEPSLDASLHALADVTESSHGLAWARSADGVLGLTAVVGRPEAGESELREMGETFRHWFEADPKPMLLDRIGADPRFAGGVPEGWGSALAVPLRHEDRLWGVFLLVREMRAGAEPSALPYDLEDAALGILVGAVASLARTREAGVESVHRAERRLRDAESQLRHVEKVAVVGERGIQIAQEIRNPVAAISGFAKRVLQALPEGDENREYLEIILREADRLERVLAEQIALAQLTRPRLKLQSLNTVVQEALELSSEDLVRRRVRLLKRLGPDLPSLLIDPDKIRQVLSNVLRYALQAVPSGGRVRVETRSGVGVVQAEIAHDGPKVAGESLDRLFVPFSTSRRYGAGVGLAVAYQMVREHGGEIRARSEGDWSSIVTIYLPVRENQDRRARPDRRAGRNDRRRRMA